MKLSMPKVITWWIAVVVGVLGVIFYFIPSLSAIGFWLVALGWLLLVLATSMKGL